MYSEDFLNTFNESELFGSCKNAVVGKLLWYDWEECSKTCDGGVRMKMAEACIPEYAVCTDLNIVRESCNTNKCPEGRLLWHDWEECSKTCGGGVRVKIAKACIPKNATCTDMNIVRESCNTNECPEDLPIGVPPGDYRVYFSYIRVISHVLSGTIMTWVPKPNANSSDQLIIDDDSWIRCDGKERCSKGLFVGQECSDLSDRVLVGAGKGGSILEFKDASLPDHAHAHTHKGTQSISYTSATSDSGTFSGMGIIPGAGTKSRTMTVDFSKMEPSEAFISSITSSDISKTVLGNDLYPQHMRVQFIFKCY